LTRPGFETGPPRWEAAINCLSYGAALDWSSFRAAAILYGLESRK
jgi:hypothetical protein